MFSYLLIYQKQKKWHVSCLLFNLFTTIIIIYLFLGYDDLAACLLDGWMDKIWVVLRIAQYT